MKLMVKGTILLAMLLVVGGSAWWYWHAHRAPAVTYLTALVTRGDLVATIAATGTVEPEEVVDVGAQVAGLITAFGMDEHGKTIDYGSEVESNTVLARIDDSMYAADAAQADAQLQQAKAGEVSAKANLQQLKAKLDQAQRDWARAQKIGPSGALAQSVFDAYRSNYDSAIANVAVGEAAILQARAAVAQAQAAVSRAQLNLGYCVIKSPVKGVIIDRRVNIGQTVVSSLNAPSLFLLAQDLKRMQVWVAVNEADIGLIKPGLPVTFTVDAYPDVVFKGEVGQVRLNATMTQNVVTYTVEIVTDNSNGKLLPYLTANVKFQVSHHEKVLLVPIAAVHWMPPPQLIAPDVRTVGTGRRRRSPGGGAQEGGPETSPATPSRGTVWERDGDFVRPIRVHLGLSDGVMTEVQSDSLEEGTEVVVSEAGPAAGEAGGAGPSSAGGSGSNTNPFVPQFPNRRR